MNNIHFKYHIMTYIVCYMPLPSLAMSDDISQMENEYTQAQQLQETSNQIINDCIKRLKEKNDLKEVILELHTNVFDYLNSSEYSKKLDDIFNAKFLFAQQNEIDFNIPTNTYRIKHYPQEWTNQLALGTALSTLFECSAFQDRKKERCQDVLKKLIKCHANPYLPDFFYDPLEIEQQKRDVSKWFNISPFQMAINKNLNGIVKLFLQSKHSETLWQNPHLLHYITLAQNNYKKNQFRKYYSEMKNALNIIELLMPVLNIQIAQQQNVINFQFLQTNEHTLVPSLY